METQTCAVTAAAIDQRTRVITLQIAGEKETLDQLEKRAEQCRANILRLTGARDELQGLANQMRQAEKQQAAQGDQTVDAKSPDPRDEKITTLEAEIAAMRQKIEGLMTPATIPAPILDVTPASDPAPTKPKNITGLQRANEARKAKAASKNQQGPPSAGVKKTANATNAQSG